MRGVQSVEQVACEYELLARVEAPIIAVLVAHKILANGWAKHLRILRMEEHPKRLPRLNLARQRLIIHAGKAQMRRFFRIR